MDNSSDRGSYFIKLKVDAGNLWRWTRVESKETFGDLKIRLLKSISATHMKLAMQYALKLSFVSSVQIPRLPKFPNEHEYIVDTINREEIKWPGSIIVVLVHVKTNTMMSNEVIDDELFTEDVFSPNKLCSCTEYLNVPPSTPGDPKALAEYLSLDVSNAALKQGRLQKRIIMNKKQEIYKEEYCYLLPNRIWYFSMKAWENEKQLSYIDLSDDTVAEHVSTSSFTFSISYGSSVQPSLLVLKAKSKEEAESWVFAVNNRHDRNDNDVICNIEFDNSNHEKLNATDDLEELSRTCSFEGMLSNRFLRESFQKYLSQKMLSSSLLFWERAEDYRRSHPSSSEPLLDSDGSENVKALDINFIKAWVQTIYQDFLQNESPYRIPWYQDVVHLVQAVSVEVQSPEPSPTLFSSIQKFCYDNMKYREYPEFMKSLNYRRLLTAAVNENFFSGIGRTWGFRKLQQDSQESHPVDGAPSSEPSNDGSKPKKMFKAFKSVFKTMKERGNISPARRSAESCNFTANIGRTNKIDLTNVMLNYRAKAVNKLGTFWYPDSWWDVEAQYLMGESSPYLHECAKSTVDDVNLMWSLWDATVADETQILIEKFVSSIEKRLLREIACLRNLQAQFRALKVRDESEALDELLCGGGSGGNSTLKNSGSSALNRYSSFTQPTSATGFFGLGMVVITGIMRCCHDRRGQQLAAIQLANSSSSPTVNQTTGLDTTTRGRSMSKESRTMSTPMSFDDDSGSRDESATSSNLGGQSEEVPTTVIANNANSNDSLRQYCVLCEILGHGRILLFDLSSMCLNAVIDMNFVTELSLSGTVLHELIIKDKNGIAWQLCPEPVDEEDGRFLTQRWLNLLSGYCNSSVRAVRIVYGGYLSKRGAINTSFKRRWFVLSSDCKLRYYKDSSSGVIKGEINLKRVTTVSRSEHEDTKWKTEGSFENRFRRLTTNEEQVPTVTVTNNLSVANWLKGSAGNEANKANRSKELILWTQGRLWILRADSIEDCEVWFHVLHSHVASSTVYNSSGGTLNEDDEEDHGEDSEGEQDVLKEVDSEEEN